MRKIFPIILCLTVFIISGCSNPVAETDKLKIVGSFPPLTSIAASVAGDMAVVVNLVPPGLSEHHYQLKPSDFSKLVDADLLVVNGLGLEPFVQDIADHVENPKLVILDVSNGIPAKHFDENILEVEGMEEEDENDHDDQNELDPHVWLNPDFAIIQAQNIRDALIAIDPTGEQYFRDQTETFSKNVLELKSQLLKVFEDNPPENFIVFHDAYNYFLETFALMPFKIGSFEEFPGKDPTPKQLEAIVNKIKDNTVSIVFTEPQFSPHLIETLIDDYDIKVFQLDPLGRDHDKDAYLTLLRSLAAGFVLAFQTNE